MPTAAKIAVLIACFLWAVSFIATKEALKTTPTFTLVTLRLVAGGLCFVAWFVLAGKRISWGGARWWLTLFILSLVGMGHYSVQTAGLEYTSASNASLFAVTAPISIVLLARIFLGEKVGPRKSIGILLALSGVLIVLGPDDLLEFRLSPHIMGDLLVMLSIVMWGVFTVAGKKVMEKMGALEMTAVVTLMGALWMIPVGIAELQWRAYSLDQISGMGWLAILFLGVTCTFLATLLYFVAVRQSESQKVGVYIYTIPPMTAVIDYFYTGKMLGPDFLVGSALVLAGVFLTQRG